MAVTSAALQGAVGAQNPAYRQTSHFIFADRSVTV
jgi:hypothetical protein